MALSSAVETFAVGHYCEQARRKTLSAWIFLVFLFGYTLMVRAQDDDSPAAAEIPLSCKTQTGDGAIHCFFRVEPQDSAREVVLSSSCVGEPSSDGGETCIRGSLHIAVTTTTITQPSTDEHRDDIIPESEDTQMQQAAKQQHAPSQDRTLVVGKATYRPPYSQHGHRVQQVLKRAPPTDASPQKWTDWYIELGHAHYPTVNENPADDDVWIQVELSINAYQQAIIQVGVEEDVLAFAYFFLGESYFLDPHGRHMDEALEAYQQAKEHYQRIILQQTSTQRVETKFAEACTKFGIALMATMDPEEMNPQWAFLTGRGGGDGSTSSHVRQAQESLELAIQYYDKHLLLGSSSSNIMSDWDRRELEIGYAQALQQLALAFALQSNLPQAKHWYEKTLAFQRDILLPKQTTYDAPHTKTAIADVLLSLSDTCVQLGDYPCAKQAYQEAMDFHELHNIEVAPVMQMAHIPGDDEDDNDNYGGMGGMADWDQAIEETLEALREYRLGTSSGGTTTGRHHQHGLDSPDDEYGEYYYAKDDGYEGDLLASLGTMYLSRGDANDAERAINFLEQAVAKYSLSAQDKESPAMADLCINLAMAYYRNYQFQESKTTQWQALDLYRKLYGDGMNPYLQSMGDPFSADHSGIPPMMMNRDAQHKGSQQMNGPTSKTGDSSTNEERIQKKIDLDSYRQSLENITEIVKPRDVKEEL